ncbi:type I-D CRISPR-associated helicase Cas3' [Halocatena pleomorpha]|uniref:Type I-D CRISPR-associated helicase Cas3 n=1 Tax=Halocatena pleomorpha TaxID=1785090 RepID=A0A3P3R780_9EURY|nr:type I-D CRISPR-associated helicase Cas3' [Halocatena pleomorpha]RRJ28490.1 type I-D CRISPR-associated helicase Cas3' [Halocatena pleomorpha]
MTLDRLFDTQLRLAGAWMPGTTTAEYFPLPSEHVDAHQLEMCAALQSDATVLLNTNPTGGGKTLSWVAPIIRESITDVPSLVMATYPTTALIQDQQRTILNLFRRYYGTDKAPWVSERSYELNTRSDLNGEKEATEVLTNGSEAVPLTERVAAVSSGIGDESIKTQLRDIHDKAVDTLQSTGLPTVILTTPDTLTYMATNRFHDNDISRIVPELDAIVVDEFHLTTDRARRLLPLHLDVYNRLAGRYLDTFVFLSATPEPSYIERIKRAFNPTHVSNTVLDKAPNKQSARQILPEVQLGITSQPRFTSDRLLVNNVEALAAAHEPPGQLLIIVDSIREVEAVTEAFESETDLSVGRVYGWKKKGRQQAIEKSDVVVGNSAVEVGVDFDRVNRLICTGYEPSSTLQRIGRMRYRSQFNDYRALLITTPAVQEYLVTMTDGDTLARSTFDDALHNVNNAVTNRPYYDVLCGAYPRYLWEHTDRSLDEQYALKDAAYRTTAFDHFGPDFEQFFDQQMTEPAFWALADQLVSESPTADIFERLHSYRSSSLGCLVIDVNDSEERLKMSSLYHVMRHREGEVIPCDDLLNRFETVIGRQPSSEERSFFTQHINYAAAGFVATGRCETPRDYYLNDFGFLHRMEKRAKSGNLHRAIGTIDDPEVKTSPGVIGTEHIDIGDTGVLAQFVRDDVERARARFGLGPYAAVIPTPQSGTLLLWDDAIKAHAQLVAQKR